MNNQNENPSLNNVSNNIESNSNPQYSSVISQRLAVAKTVDTNLTKEEEAIFDKATAQSHDSEKNSKKKWLIFSIIYLGMIAILVLIISNMHF